MEFDPDLGQDKIHKSGKWYHEIRCLEVDPDLGQDRIQSKNPLNVQAELYLREINLGNRVLTFTVL